VASLGELTRLTPSKEKWTNEVGQVKGAGLHLWVTVMSKKGRQFLQEKINGLNWQTLMT